jgi:hypothetical protein
MKIASQVQFLVQVTVHIFIMLPANKSSMHIMRAQIKVNMKRNKVVTYHFSIHSVVLCSLYEHI